MAGFLSVMASTATATAPAAPAPGGANLGDVQVTKSGFTAILAARTAGGAKIDPTSVKATIGGVGAPVSVQPIAPERRATTLLIDTSGSMGLAGMQTVVRAADAFLAPHPAGGIRSLMVSATADGKAFAGSTVVNLAAPASGVQPPPTATSNGGLGGVWLLWLAGFAIFLGLVGGVVALVMPAHVSRRQRQVESIEGYISAKPSREDEGSAVAAITASLVHLGDKVMDSRTSTPRTQLLLDRADLPLRPGEWAVLRVFAVVVGIAGGLFLLHDSLTSECIGAFLGGLVGVVVPALFLKFAASHRAAKFERQLADVLTLVASSLSTGFSLLQALDAVARDADEPSAKEFSRALAETRIGADLNDSLDHLADRMGSKNLRWTAMAIDIQRQVGGNLAETLRNTAATLRDREALSRHVKALSAEGRLSAYILIALPIGIFLYMLGVNRAYVELLWTTMIGMGMLAGGVISLTIGVFWMNKVVKVEV